MKMNVSIPSASTLDWDGKYYALLSTGLYRSRIWSVGTSVEDAKQRAINIVMSRKESQYKRHMCRYISEADIGSPSVQKHHGWMKFSIAECDYKLYLYFNEGLCKSESYIFENADEPIKIKYAL